MGRGGRWDSLTERRFWSVILSWEKWEVAVIQFPWSEDVPKAEIHRRNLTRYGDSSVPRGTPVNLQHWWEDSINSMDGNGKPTSYHRRGSMFSVTFGSLFFVPPWCKLLGERLCLHWISIKMTGAIKLNLGSRGHNRTNYKQAWAEGIATNLKICYSERWG